MQSKGPLSASVILLINKGLQEFTSSAPWMKIRKESPIRDSQPSALHPPRPLAQRTTEKQDTGGAGWISNGFNRRDSVVAHRSEADPHASPNHPGTLLSPRIRHPGCERGCAAIRVPDRDKLVSEKGSSAPGCRPHEQATSAIIFLESCNCKIAYTPQKCSKGEERSLLDWRWGHDHR